MEIFKKFILFYVYEIFPACMHVYYVCVWFL